MIDQIHRQGTLAPAATAPTRTVVTRSGLRMRGYLSCGPFESLIERDAMLVLLADPRVTRVQPQPFKVTYRDGDEKRHHFPDILAEGPTSPWVIEVKDDRRARRPEVLRRTRLMQSVFATQGMHYVLWPASAILAMSEAVEAAVIWHQDLNDMMNRIELLHRRGAEDTAKRSRQGRGLAILGAAGTGKSSIADLYRDQEAPDRSKVLAVTVHTSGRASAIVPNMLDALGDDHPNLGSLQHKEARCVEMIRDSGIELIFLDEIHHFLGRSSHQDVNTRGGHWLKQFLDRCGVPAVVLGTPAAKGLLDTHDELRQRLPYQIWDPFRWDVPEKRTQFLAVLHEIEGLLPFGRHDVLGEPGVAREIYRATGGSLRAVKHLIIEVSTKAMLQGRPGLTVEMVLAEARAQSVHADADEPQKPRKGRAA